MSVRCPFCPAFVDEDEDAVEDHLSQHEHLMYSCLICQKKR